MGRALSEPHGLRSPSKTKSGWCHVDIKQSASRARRAVGFLCKTPCPLGISARREKQLSRPTGGNCGIFPFSSNPSPLVQRDGGRAGSGRVCHGWQRDLRPTRSSAGAASGAPAGPPAGYQHNAETASSATRKAPPPSQARSELLKAFPRCPGRRDPSDSPAPAGVTGDKPRQRCCPPAPSTPGLLQQRSSLKDEAAPAARWAWRRFPAAQSCSSPTGALRAGDVTSEEFKPTLKTAQNWAYWKYEYGCESCNFSTLLFN